MSNLGLYLTLSVTQLGYTLILIYYIGEISREILKAIKETKKSKRS